MPRAQKLLFRWTGSDIEKPGPKKGAIITPTQRETYLTYLENALDPEKGLYAKIPKEEYLGSVSKTKDKGLSAWQFESTLPCLCFTELDLGDCAGHWKNFGRLAFGFTKQFIVEQGGGPMQYCLGTKDCKRIRDLDLILKYLKSKGKGGKTADKEVLDAFTRLTHFYKRLRESVKNRKSPKPNSSDDKPGHERKQPRERDIEEDRARNACYGKLRGMKHLEEHEWRLVFTQNNKCWHKIGVETDPKTAWFRIKVGTELQMVIVPDNRCLQIVHENSRFSDPLFKLPEKPVQVVSLDGLERPV
jgi:hypothetical protein